MHDYPYSKCLIIHNHACKRHYHAYSAAHYHKKTHVKFQPKLLEIFRQKVEKVKKHNFCIIYAHYLLPAHVIASYLSPVTVKQDFLCVRQELFSASHNDQHVFKFNNKYCFVNYYPSKILL